MGKSIIKEMFVISLLIVVIMFTVGILLYDYIPTNQTLPEPIEYMADSTVTSVLQEIQISQENQNGEENDSSEDTDSLLKSYTIDEYDLRNYKSKNAFASGKNDPFADYQITPDGSSLDPNNTVTGSSNTNSVVGNKTNTNTGTFFENPNSK